MSHPVEKENENSTPTGQTEIRTQPGVSIGVGNSALLYSKLLRPARSADEMGRLAGFKIIRMIGQGGMGVVFEAYDEQLKRPLALKVLQPQSQSDARARERFVEEARACAALRHDHIVPLYQVGEDNGVIFLAMPLLQGMALDRWLKQQTQPHLMQILRIGREAADGLAAAHAVGILHRDIKLANIWLEAPKGRVVLLDFGLSGKVESATVQGNKQECVGTTGYISPEQVLGMRMDHRSDLFSLGVVLYRLSTMQMPFPGSDTLVTYYDSVRRHQPTPPHEINPALPVGFSQLVMALLSRQPELRPESAKMVRVALQQLQDEALQSEVDRQGSPQELLRQGIVVLPADGGYDPVAGQQTTSLTSYYVPQRRQRLSMQVVMLALFMGILLAMGLWIYDKPGEETRPVLGDSMAPLRHVKAHNLLKQTGLVTASQIKEASALLKSRKHEGLYYTLCDANNPSELYAIDDKGKLHATLKLANVANVDWEALTSDEQGNIYVGDIGNNLHRHKERSIYRIVEPAQFTGKSPSDPQVVSVTGTWRYTYPRKPFDAESLMLADEQFWIVSKARHLGETQLYRLPVAGEGTSQPVIEVGKLPKELLMIADASLSPDRQRLALVNKFYAVVYPLERGKVEEILSVHPAFYEFDLFKVEGCTWDGADLLMIAEDRKVYRLPMTSK